AQPFFHQSLFWSHPSAIGISGHGIFLNPLNSEGRLLPVLVWCKLEYSSLDLRCEVTIHVLESHVLLVLDLQYMAGSLRGVNDGRVTRFEILDQNGDLVVFRSVFRHL